jgi:hypothetical protein
VLGTILIAESSYNQPYAVSDPPAPLTRETGYVPFNHLYRFDPAFLLCLLRSETQLNSVQHSPKDITDEHNSRDIAVDHNAEDTSKDTSVGRTGRRLGKCRGN